MTVNRGVLVLSARRLFYIARNAAEQSKDFDNNCVIAVVFAAASIEALMNEVTEWVDFEIPEEEDAGDRIIPEVKAFSGVIKEAEQCRVPLGVKFLLASALLTGHSYEKGSEPFQDFAVLMRVRDAVMHLKPSVMMYDGETSWMEAGKVLRELEQRKLVTRREPRVAADLLTQISNPAVARWAVGAAADMAQSFVRLFPGHIGESLLSDYGDDFKGPQ